MKEELKKMKVCLIGEGEVGKTSLVRRFVLNEFDEKYLYTLGTNIFKKEVVLVPRNGRKTKVTMMVWDIAGQKDLRHLFTKSFFKGAVGGIAVCDSTRGDTVADLNDWIECMYEVCGPIPITVLANKVDLKEQMELTEDKLSEFAEKHNAQYLFTSAKTGENVEEAFVLMAKQIVEQAP